MRSLNITSLIFALSITTCSSEDEYGTEIRIPLINDHTPTCSLFDYFRRSEDHDIFSLLNDPVFFHTLKHLLSDQKIVRILKDIIRHCFINMKDLDAVFNIINVSDNNVFSKVSFIDILDLFSTSKSIRIEHNTYNIICTINKILKIYKNMPKIVELTKKIDKLIRAYNEYFRKTEDAFENDLSNKIRFSRKILKIFLINIYKNKYSEHDLKIPIFRLGIEELLTEDQRSDIVYQIINNLNNGLYDIKPEEIKFVDSIESYFKTRILNLKMAMLKLLAYIQSVKGKIENEQEFDMFFNEAFDIYLEELKLLAIDTSVVYNNQGFPDHNNN